jgi:iron complex transport system substrate-binding protein
MLEGRGVRVWCCDFEADNLDEMYEQLALLGQMVGRSDEANAVVASLRQRVAAVQNRLADIAPADQVTGIWETAGHGYVGADTMAGDIFRRARVINVAGVFVGGSGYPILEWGDVIAKNPQIYVIGDADLGVTVADLKARDGSARIDAVRTGRIFEIPRAISTRPGPRNVDALEQLAKLIYPDRF